MKKVLWLFCLSLLLVSCSNYSSGERTGVITKFSNKGVVFKSYEGELKVSPSVGGFTGQYETFEFSLDNDEKIKCVTPVDSIFAYARSGVPVTVRYQETMWLNWFRNRGDKNCFVIEVIPRGQIHEAADVEGYTVSDTEVANN